MDSVVMFIIHRKSVSALQVQNGLVKTHIATISLTRRDYEYSYSNSVNCPTSFNRLSFSCTIDKLVPVYAGVILFVFIAFRLVP